MASTAPMVLPCERCSSWRSELATGSLAGAWAKAIVAKATRDTTIRIRFTEKPPEGFKDITLDVIWSFPLQNPLTTGSTGLHRGRIVIPQDAAASFRGTLRAENWLR